MLRRQLSVLEFLSMQRHIKHNLSALLKRLSYSPVHVFLQRLGKIVVNSSLLNVPGHLCSYKWMTCAPERITFSIQSLSCEPNQMYQPQTIAQILYETWLKISDLWVDKASPISINFWGHNDLTPMRFASKHVHHVWCLSLCCVACDLWAWSLFIYLIHY